MILLAGAVLAGANAVPAFAVTNLIVNGSFEAGAVGIDGFTGWTKINVPSNAQASVIPYNVSAGYPNGAFGEVVPVANVATVSPDAASGKAAYFVGDRSVDESIKQLTWLTPGKYRVGFSYFLTQNGLNNVGNASFAATIVGVQVASTAINAQSPARVWQYASGVGQIQWAGWYDTAFVFNSNQNPSKDIVIDQVFAVATTDAAEVIIPGVPEPQTWAMLVLGFGLVGAAMRRRTAAVA